MLSEVFYWLLSMSVSASIAGIIILFMSRIRRIPHRMLSALWGIPFLRMWIPIAVNSPYSVLTLLSGTEQKTVIVYQSAVNFSMTNFVRAAEDYFPVMYKTSLLENTFQIAAVVWFAVSAALLAAMCIAYALASAQLKNARHLRDHIYLSDRIASPVTYGLIRGRIFMPEQYEGSDMKYILLHENAHIRRKDNLRRIAGITTACVHWFNPLSWLFLKKFLESLELACDEAALKQCGEAEKKNYASALLNCAESKALYASSFGGAKTKLRIERILSYKKLSVFSTAGLMVLAVAIGLALLTNAAA